MANEARVFAEGPDFCKVRQFTVADGTAIAKGALLVFTGATRTAVVHTAAVKKAALGFAVQSKTASDGVTEIGVQRTGVVDAYADGYISTGDIVLAGQTTANRVQALADGYLSVYNFQSQVIGRALENAANGTYCKIALALG